MFGRILFFWVLISMLVIEGQVELGTDVFFKEKRWRALRGKRVGIVTNQTGVDCVLKSTWKELKTVLGDSLVALFSPEHGLYGISYAGEKIENRFEEGIPCYSLYGKNRRPTPEMLKNLQVIIYDIQDIGCRSYTYATTLYYVMEEAAKTGIKVIVLDRPNPMGGVIVDGPMVNETCRSFLAYIDIPYCHGMTIGELARYFQGEYEPGCLLEVIPMKGWTREMKFRDTELGWIPPSPQIPEADTPFFYASVGIIGELGWLNIGIGYTLPFKVIGAPWIQADRLLEALQQQRLPGVTFFPTHFKPFWGCYAKEVCHGVGFIITDHLRFLPITTTYAIITVLKSLYPKEIIDRIERTSDETQRIVTQVVGNKNFFTCLLKEKNGKQNNWIEIDANRRKVFMGKRKKYLIY